MHHNILSYGVNTSSYPINKLPYFLYLTPWALIKILTAVSRRGVVNVKMSIIIKGNFPNCTQLQQTKPIF